MGKESLYYIIVFLTFLYVIYKNKGSTVKILIILCFYAGLASFFGKGIENPYKILLVLLSVFLLIKYRALTNFSRRERFFIIIFGLFSVTFLFSAFINNGYFTLIFSQYGKYFTPVCLYFVLRSILLRNPSAYSKLNDLFFDLLSVQIILSAVKIITIGLQESVVGSLAYIGGGPATVIPVLGFILVWIHTRGEIKRKDWIYIILLIFIGFASVKRAIWFIMPTFIFLFMYYVPRKNKANHLMYVFFLVPLIFYAGIRLNPTLNKEGKIGGSFDLQFVKDYIQNYSFGKTAEASEIQSGTGRGGATLLLFNKLFSGQTLSFNDYWGSGLQDVYTTTYEEFNEDKYGVNSKGAVTGVFQTYIASGYVGVIFAALLIISVINMMIEPRIRNVLALLIFWDYIFYSGLIFTSQALFILFFYLILYSNFQFRQRFSIRYLQHHPDGTHRYI